MIRRFFGFVIIIQVIRAVFYPFVTDLANHGPDGDVYISLAHTYIQTNFPWEAAGTFYPCGYSFILGFVYQIFGSSMVVTRALNSVAWLITLLFVFLMARRLFGHDTALVAGLLFALDEPYKFIPYTNYTLLFMLLVTSLLFLLLLLRGREDPSLTVPAGVLSGLACLVQGKFMAVLSTLPFLGLVVHGFSWKGLRSYSTATVVGLFFVTTWSYRNYLVTGRLILVSSNGPKTFACGNSPYSTGTASIRGDEEALYAGRTAAEQDCIATEKAWRFIREHLGYWSWILVPRKFWYFWGFENLRDQFIFWLFVLGSLLAAYTGRSREVLPALWAVACLTGVSLLYHGEGHYRFPVLPAVHLLAAYAVTTLHRWGDVTGKRPTGYSPGLAEVVLLALMIPASLIALRSYATARPEVIYADRQEKGDQVELRCWANTYAPVSFTIIGEDNQKTLMMANLDLSVWRHRAFAAISVIRRARRILVATEGEEPHGVPYCRVEQP